MIIPSGMRARMEDDLRTMRESAVEDTPLVIDRQLASLRRNRAALRMAGFDTTEVDQAIADRSVGS